MKFTVLFVVLLSVLGACAQGPPYPYTVPNTWTASKDTVAGYNVYRAVQTGTTCGAFTKLNTPLITATNYTDSTVVDETTYCYGATAVDSNGRESGFSNIVQNIIVGPAPPTGFGSVVAKVNGQEDITATWAQSKDPHITANDLYAGLKSGGPYNSLHVRLQPSTQFVYKNAPKGNFFAVVTATAKTESGKSNEVKIVVP